MRAKRLLVSAICLLTASAPPAGAAETSQGSTCRPDQDVAALDQYCDFLPTSASGSTPTGSARAKQRSLEQSLTTAEAERLRKAGMPGKVLLVMPTLAPVTPEQARAALRRRDELRSRRLVPAVKEPRERDVRRLAEGMVSAAGDVVGGAFRWGLVLSSLGLAGIAWLRFRSRLRV